MGTSSKVAENRGESTLNPYLTYGGIFALLVSSVFQGAALFSITTPQGFTAGIAPYWLFAALSLLVAARHFLARRTSAVEMLPRETRLASLCLMAFAAYGVASAFILPFVFNGIRVIDPRLGMDSQYLNPSALHWSLSNAGQAGYMLLNAGVFLLLVSALKSTQVFAATPTILLGVACLVLGFGLFQHFSVRYAPNDLYQMLYAGTHNNPALYSYPMLDPRTNSLFLEPSYFAGYAVAACIVGLNAYLYSGTRWWLALGAIACYGALTSESSLGMVVLPVAIALSAIVLAVRRTRERAGVVEGQARGRLTIGLLVLIAVLILFLAESALTRPAALPMPNPIPSELPVVGTPSPLEAPTEIASPPQPPGWLSRLTPGSRTWEDRLLSARYRLWADWFSTFVVPRETYFLGAGLGSNRPSSFVPYVISNMGLPGLVAFLGFVLLLARSFVRNVPRLSPAALALGLGFFTYLLCMLSGLPDPSWPPFLWIFAGIAVAGMGEAAKSAEG